MAGSALLLILVVWLLMPPTGSEKNGEAMVKLHAGISPGQRREPEVTRQEVRREQDDGRLVESRTEVSEEKVVSTIAETRTDGVRETWVFTDNFKDDSKDLVVRTREQLGQGGKPEPGTLICEEGLAPLSFLAKKGALFSEKSAGVDFGPGKLAYAAEYSSAVVLSSGHDAHGEPVHVLASLGVHAAFPFPGEHWDEGQLAILDGDYDKKVSLRMPADLEDTHLNVKFEDFTAADGSPAMRITYQGYMEDDAGKLRFVEADYELLKRDVEKKDPSLWDRITDGLNSLVGFEQNARVMGELETPASSLKIDGEQVLAIERTISAVDDGARFNMLANTRLTAINYAPETAPLLSLLDPKEGEARYRFDATLLEDQKSFLHKLLPRFARQGILAAHYTVDQEGHRKDVDERMEIDGAPLSVKNYSWEFDGEPAALLRRELVRFKDPEGNVELGFRETIVKQP